MWEVFSVPLVVPDGIASWTGEYVSIIMYIIVSFKYTWGSILFNHFRNCQNSWMKMEIFIGMPSEQAHILMHDVH